MRLSVLAACLLLSAPAFAGAERPLFAPVFGAARTPVGWADYCAEQPRECRGPALPPLDIAMTKAAWGDLLQVNRWANDTVKPLSDMDHWGVSEKWSLPDDGYGDCEDYVLLKRKTLIDAGWPRQALLITVVRDRQGKGHAVLTVKSDRGEFILDNEDEEVKDWTRTGYRFVKRQSQGNQNAWVGLEGARPAPQAALSRAAE